MLVTWSAASELVGARPSPPVASSPSLPPQPMTFRAAVYYRVVSSIICGHSVTSLWRHTHHQHHQTRVCVVRVMLAENVEWKHRRRFIFCPCFRRLRQMLFCLKLQFFDTKLNAFRRRETNVARKFRNVEQSKISRFYFSSDVVLLCHVHYTRCFIKTTTRYLIAHNFGKCWPIFNILSLSDSAVNV